MFTWLSVGRPKRAGVNPHPGKVGVKTRRTSAQVLADKAEALAKKELKAAAAAAAKEKKLKTIAEIEDRMAVNEEKRKKDATRPPPGKVAVNIAKPVARMSTPEVNKEVDLLLAAHNDLVEVDLDPDKDSQLLVYRPRPKQSKHVSEENGSDFEMEDNENGKTDGM